MWDHLLFGGDRGEIVPSLSHSRCYEVIAVAVLMIGSSVFADSVAPPFSYKKECPGGKFVFVMIAPMSVEKDAGHWIEKIGAEIRGIRRIYARSGLYRNDESTEPLWTIDWYAAGVELASDGVHLIRHGPWASSTDQEALSFFANGELLRTYQIKELVDDPLLLDHTVSHFFWQSGGWMNDSRLQYTLITKDGNQFVFDLRTGEIISKSPANHNIIWPVIIVGGVAILGVIAWLIERRFRRVKYL
jgi:hypothetical protein